MYIYIYTSIDLHMCFGNYILYLCIFCVFVCLGVCVG